MEGLLCEPFRIQKEDYFLSYNKYQKDRTQVVADVSLVGLGIIQFDNDVSLPICGYKSLTACERTYC